MIKLIYPKNWSYHVIKECHPYEENKPDIFPVLVHNPKYIDQIKILFIKFS